MHGRLAALDATERGFDRYVYGLAIAASIVLSAWGAWAAYVVNPDAALYLRAAELFAHGHWSDAFATFRWPLYSLLTAGVMVVSGLKASPAAQIINALLDVVMTVSFIALCGRLGKGDRLLIVCAAIVIVLCPKLTELRSVVVRDHGYFAFLMLTLYFVARDIAAPRRATKLAIAASIVVASLFRIEGFYFAALVPMYYLMQRPWTWRSLSVLSTGVGVAILVAAIGLLIWTEADRSGGFGVGDLVGHTSEAFARIAQRVHDLKHVVLYPFGGGEAKAAYVAVAISITVVGIARAMTIPIAAVTVLAFFPWRQMPRQVNGFVLWFAFGQLPVLLTQSFLRFFLDYRHAMGLTLVLDIALVYLLAAMVRGWPDYRARVGLPIAAIVLVLTWASSIPGPSKLGYLKEAGEWMAREVPKEAVVFTNDGRIAYYSGRPYDLSTRIWQSGFAKKPNERILAGMDYFAIVTLDSSGTLPDFIDRMPKHLVRAFPGRDGRTAMIFVKP